MSEPPWVSPPISVAVVVPGGGEEAKLGTLVPVPSNLYHSSSGVFCPKAVVHASKNKNRVEIFLILMIIGWKIVDSANIADFHGNLIGKSVLLSFFNASLIFNRLIIGVLEILLPYG